MSGNDYNDDDNQAVKFRKLFIGGLNDETTEDTIKHYFGKWGEIVDCTVMKNPETKRSRGFGFITYKTAEMLDDVQNNRPHKIDNRQLDTKRAIPRGESNESQSSVKKMFVGGLKDDMAEDDVREVFSRFGKILKLETLNDKNTGKRKGFCFIIFEDFDSVDKCVLRQRISIGGKYVEVKKAVPKEIRMGNGNGGFDGANRRDSNNGYGAQGNPGFPSNNTVENRGHQGYGRNRGGYQGGNDSSGYQGYGGRNQGGNGSGGNHGGSGYQGYGGGNQGGNSSSGYQGYSGGNKGGNGGSGYQGYGGGNGSSGYQGYGGGNQGGNSNSGYQGYGGRNLGGYSRGNANSGRSGREGNNNNSSGFGAGPFRGSRVAKKGVGPYGNGYGRGAYR